MSTPTAASPTTASAMQCPICGSHQFGDFRSRPNIRCRGCGSFERSRLLWLVLGKLDLDRLRQPFFHLAPEIGIAKLMHQRLGDRYRAFDFAPEIYAKARIPVGRLDLCEDLAAMDSGSVGALCHVHVLEHVRCNAALVLQQINRVLAPGGYHIFGVPFWSRQYREDLSSELTDADRLERFGHEDHVRSFGDQDFDLMFGGAFAGMEAVPLTTLIDADTASRANIPPRALARNNSHSLYVYRKPMAD